MGMTLPIGDIHKCGSGESTQGSLLPNHLEVSVTSGSARKGASGWTHFASRKATSCDPPGDWMTSARYLPACRSRFTLLWTSLGGMNEPSTLMPGYAFSNSVTEMLR